jgi:hypothetical protein
MKHYTLLIIVCSFFGSNLLAQTGTVKGKVTLKDGAPLALVHVSVKGKGILASTDDRGSYVLSNVPEGNQTLAISSIGFES